MTLHREDRRTRVMPDAAIAALIGAFAFCFRLLAHSDFANEQFIVLSQAQAWLAGDWPIRDYTQPGLIMSDGLSALAQALLGPTLLSELVLGIGALAVASAVTYVVTARVTGRRWLGVVAALLQICAHPVLFSYPKLLIYPVLLALSLAYARVQTWPRLLLLAGWSAFAFLVRQDHGVYAFLAGLVLMVSVHHADGLRRAVRSAGAFALVFVAFLSPYLMYVQAVVGLQPYVALGIEMSRIEAARDGRSLPSFAGIEAGPLFVVRALEEDDLPFIRIRWAPEVTDDTRSAIEQRGQLRNGEFLEKRTWGYRVPLDALGALGTVINEPAVEDVSGIDRSTLRLTGESLSQRLFRGTNLGRLEFGPPVRSIVSLGNVEPFLFYLCYLLPAFALVLWWRVPRPEHAASHETRLLLPPFCLLSLACTAGLLRFNTARLPDVFGTAPILLCWIVSVLYGCGVGSRRLASRAAAVALVGATATATYQIGGGRWEVVHDAVLRPSQAVARAVETTRSARTWPWESQWPGDEEWKLAVYVHDCTNADDRLLVTWQAPEFFYFSRRVFAGREGALLRILRSPDTYEPQVLDAWRSQNVPIVLTSDESDAEFTTAFPVLANHLQNAYMVAGTTRWGDRPSITVHVDKNRVPLRKDPEFGLPCFTSARPVLN